MKMLKKLCLVAAVAFAAGNCASYQPKPMSGRSKRATLVELNAKERKAWAKCESNRNRKLAILYKKCANETVRETEEALLDEKMNECKAKASTKKVYAFDTYEISPSMVDDEDRITRAVKVAPAISAELN